MVTTEEIKNVFSILHDGMICACTGNKKLLTLTVECQYLAEKIDRSFDKFYIELHQIEKIELELWRDSAALPRIIKTGISEIFKTEIGILSAQIKGDTVVVTCDEYDTDLKYPGADLSINCEAIKVFDQNKNELTMSQLNKICNDYWDEWENKNIIDRFMII